MQETNSTITQTILNTINSLFSSLFSSIDNSIYSLLDDLVFINEDILQDNFMSKFFGTSATSRFNYYFKFSVAWLFIILYFKICIFTLLKFIYRTAISIYF